jgi:hypothetical protein
MNGDIGSGRGRRAGVLGIVLAGIVLLVAACGGVPEVPAPGRAVTGPTAIWWRARGR